MEDLTFILGLCIGFVAGLYTGLMLVIYYKKQKRLDKLKAQLNNIVPAHVRCGECVAADKIICLHHEGDHVA